MSFNILKDGNKKPTYFICMPLFFCLLQQQGFSCVQTPGYHHTMSFQSRVSTTLPHIVNPNYGAKLVRVKRCGGAIKGTLYKQ